MFNSDEEMYDDEHTEHSRHGRGFGDKAGLFILKMIGIIFVLPAMAVGWLQFYLLFMKGKFRLSVTSIILAIEMLILIPILTLSNPFALIKEALTSWDIRGMIVPYLAICLITGVVGSYIVIAIKVFQFKTNPSQLEMDGWSYRFTYRDTPWETAKRKYLKKAMIEGQYYGDEESPIGILQEPTQMQVAQIDDSKLSLVSNKARVISRSYEDAMKHSVVTGETGSGKALHVATVIPTPSGNRTVGDLKVGEIIYDENKEPTTILAKFQPMTEDHYELSFNKGTEFVKACGDHLWEVVIDGKAVIKNTRELVEVYADVHVEGLNGLKHRIDNISEIDDNKEDYYCFTVDSKSSLFMCTESFIPTHNTVTLLSLIYNDIQNGYPVCVVDFKKSPDVLYFLSKWAKEYGREFYYFSGGDSSDRGNQFYGEKATYDPFASGEQNARADVVLNLRQWDSSSDVYRSRTEAILIALFFALLNANKEDVPNVPWDKGALHQIIASMELPVMYDLIASLEKDRIARQGTRDAISETDADRIKTLQNIYESLKSNTSDGKALREQIEGIKLICNKLTMSSYGSWLSKGMSSKHIDLLKIATSNQGPIVLFGLSPMEEQDFAKSMGSIIMSDLKRTAHTKNEMHNKIPFGVYIDEFQTIDPSDVTDLLEKSRSAKFFCTIASQSLEQIVVASKDNGEATLKSVLDTCGNYIFHSGAKQDSAERMAKVLGQTERIVRTITTATNSKVLSLNLLNQRRGRTNKSIMHDWIISPSKFQNLSSPSAANGFKSEAYVITKVEDDQGVYTGLGAQRVQIIAQREITDGIPKEFLQFIGNSSAQRYKRQTGEDISGLAGIDLFQPKEVDEIDDIANIELNKKTPVETYAPHEEPDYIESYIDEEDDWGIEAIEDDSKDSMNEIESMFSDVSIERPAPDINVNKAVTRKSPQRRGGISTNTKSIAKEAPVKLKEFPKERPLTSFEKMQLARKTGSKQPKKDKSNDSERNVNREVKKSNIKEESGFKLPDL